MTGPHFSGKDGNTSTFLAFSTGKDQLSGSRLCHRNRPALGSIAAETDAFDSGRQPKNRAWFRIFQPKVRFCQKEAAMAYKDKTFRTLRMVQRMRIWHAYFHQLQSTLYRSDGKQDAQAHKVYITKLHEAHASSAPAFRRIEPLCSPKPVSTPVVN